MSAPRILVSGGNRLSVAIEERLIESANWFEGKRVAVGDGALRNPRNWWVVRNPFRPSWGEPYLEIAQRMYVAVLAAREAAEGHEAVCVSHQLPIWILRRYLEKRRLWHDPRRRQCALASLTSVPFQDEILDYSPVLSMVQTAQNVAEVYGLSREELDEFSVNSHRKAVAGYVAGRPVGEAAPPSTVGRCTSAPPAIAAAAVANGWSGWGGAVNNTLRAARHTGPSLTLRACEFN